MAKTLVFMGLLLLMAGVPMYFFPGVFKHAGKLPGDIHIRKEGFSFHFPWVTCLVVSIVLSVIMWFLKK